MAAASNGGWRLSSMAGVCGRNDSAMFLENSSVTAGLRGGGAMLAGWRNGG